MTARALLILLAGLPLLTACSGKAAPDLFEGQSVLESRWAVNFNAGDESTPLTVVLLNQESFDGRARLLILSSFGASLGDCRLDKGRINCRNSVPGVSPLTDKVASGFRDMLGTDGVGLLVRESGPPLQGSGWEAGRTSDGLEYRRQTSPAWSLQLKRIS